MFSILIVTELLVVTCEVPREVR